jgi:hypothetical protein
MIYTILKAIFLIILLFLAVIGLAEIEFLVTATYYDEDDMENNQESK